MPNKIDSNTVSTFFAVESSPKVLPGSPVWYELEANSFPQFGGQITNQARKPFNSSRQRLKGSPVTKDASGGVNMDVTASNTTRLMQGFMFANAREHADTAPLNGTAVPITSTTATTYAAASGLTAFKAGDIVFGSGFGVAANNGVKVLSLATGTTLTTTGNAVEASPPATASVEAVGFQFASGDCTLTVASGVLTIGATVKNLTDLGLSVGEWIFIGGDATITKPVTSPVGYARVKSVSATAIVCDKVTAAFVTDTCVGKTIQLFYGKFLRNEAYAQIVQNTYQIERQLGNDGVGIQSEYLLGAVPNDFTLSLPVGDKLACDMSFVALDHEGRSGTLGVKAGTRIAALNESMYNTSSMLYRFKMNIIDEATLQPTALFGYITDGSISIKNGVQIIKAVGAVSGVDFCLSDFEVSGNVKALFTTLAAVDAIKNNSSVTIDAIVAFGNTGIIYDIPLLTLGGGQLDVQMDQPITIPLEINAARGTTGGYTLGVNYFTYLPNAAMPA